MNAYLFFKLLSMVLILTASAVAAVAALAGAFALVLYCI